MMPVLYLSKDKIYLTDERGSNVSIRVKEGGNVYYKIIAIESEAVEKVCMGTERTRVCTLWNEDHECLVFGEVDMCTKWKLVPKGYSNIS